MSINVDDAIDSTPDWSPDSSDLGGQPYPYRRVELVEPDWTRFPGWKDVTAEEWALRPVAARPLREEPRPAARPARRPRRRVLLRRPGPRPGRAGHHVDAGAAADDEHDGARRHTGRCRLADRRVLRRPDPPLHAAGALRPSYRLAVAPARHPRLAARARHVGGRGADPPLPDQGARRAAADLPAVLRPLHPDGPRRQLHPGGRQAQVRSASPSTGSPTMLDYLRRTPQVRDVVVSGGDVANMPWARLEDFLTRLLEIENIRDIRLATKALMGLPQHWLQDEVVEGMTRVAGTARARGVSLAIHTHVNHANSVTPLVAKATQAMFDAGVRDVRNQGVHPQRRQRRPARAARPVLPAARRRADPALLLLHVRHDPVRRALADLGRRRPAAAAPHHGLPARLRDAAHRVRRAVRRQALGAPARDVRRGARHLLLDEELPHLDRGHRPRGAHRAPTSTTTRSTRCRPRARRGGRSTGSSTSRT